MSETKKEKDDRIKTETATDRALQEQGFSFSKLAAKGFVVALAGLGIFWCVQYYQAHQFHVTLIEADCGSSRSQATRTRPIGNYPTMRPAGQLSTTTARKLIEKYGR